jgi:hypothetical protein
MLSQVKGLDDAKLAENDEILNKISHDQTGIRTPEH